MHKRLLIYALILIFIAFISAQISQRQHTFVTGNLVAGEKPSQDDLFLPQEQQSLPQKPQQPSREPPKTAFGYIVRWLGISS